MFRDYLRSARSGTPTKMERTTASPPTERELVELARERLASALPDGWDTRVDRGARRADALLRLRAPDGNSAVLVVEAKTVVDTRDVPALKERLRADDSAAGEAMVVARYLSPRARASLAAAGMSYLDATGNVRVTVAQPAVFFAADGADRDPWRSPERPTSSLHGKPAARISRALIDLPPPWKVRQLAQAAGASLGSTARIVDFLAREALIQRDTAGAIVDVDWPALLTRWAADYDLVKRRRVVRLLAPRGADSIEGELCAWTGRYAVSGSLAAARWAPYTDAQLALVYAADADELVARLGLREAPTRPNVVVIEPDDEYVFDRGVQRDGLQLAAPAQVAVDLLAGPGRSPEEGKALIEWMTAHEPDWRHP